MYIAGAFLFPIFNKWPIVARVCVVAGMPIMAGGLLAASFATKVWHLILTQGVIYGIGGSIVYYATIMFLDEWFEQRKGTAFGVMWVSKITPFFLASFPMWKSLTTSREVQEPQVLSYHSS